MLKIGKIHWPCCQGNTISLRGESGGICTLLENTLFQDELHQTQQWSLSILLTHIQLGKIYHILNIYMVASYM